MQIGLLDWIAHLPLAAFSPRAQTALRVAYGVFLLLQLLVTLPQARRFYVSRAYAGYIDDGRLHDTLHTPRTALLLICCWILTALGIITNTATLLCAVVNVCFARYFFLHLRWRSISRGMGAPGHMSYWFATLLVLLALSEQIDVHGILRALTVVTFRVDFAAIMFAAGIYKIAAGYMRGEGFEIGLVNPWWGIFASTARRFQANSWTFRVLNHLAYGIEIACSIAFLFPPVAPYAAFIFGASFLMIGRMIRLTYLAEMVAIAAFLYIFPSDQFDHLLTGLSIPAAATMIVSAPIYTPPVIALASGLMLYLVMLLPAYTGMMINVYGRSRLVEPIQSLLDFWTRTFGLMLWRVFTLDIINFYVDIFVERDGVREQIAFPGKRTSASGRRFSHVGEFICLASVFTTLKYYPENTALFSRRLTTYARSIAQSPADIVIFRYIHISKDASTFCFREVAEFRIQDETVHEVQLDDTFDVRRPARSSPIQAGTQPGSYAPR